MTIQHMSHLLSYIQLSCCHLHSYHSHACHCHTLPCLVCMPGGGLTHVLTCCRCVVCVGGVQVVEAISGLRDAVDGSDDIDQGICEYRVLEGHGVAV